MSEILTYTEGLEFSLIEDDTGSYYSVTKYTGDSAEVIIPETYNGLPVRIIGYGTFFNCPGLTRVTIGGRVTSIERAAFSYCRSLTNITIPDSVVSIDVQAFEGCDSLTNVIIGNGVTSIGMFAFNGCSSLANVTIGSSVVSIGQGAFTECASLTSIVIPDSVTSIGEGAFSDCSSLSSVVIGDSVTSIGSWAFHGCNNLILYCEAESQPSGWDPAWNFSNCEVIWGYAVKEDDKNNEIQDSIDLRQAFINNANAQKKYFAAKAELAKAAFSGQFEDIIIGSDIVFILDAGGADTQLATLDKTILL